MSPHANRCVVFFSDLVEHEVLAAHAHRMAITVWLSKCGSALVGASEKDLLSREFFKLACHHAQTHNATTENPTVESQPEAAAKDSRQARIARLPSKVSEAPRAPGEEAEGPQLSAAGLDTSKCEQAGSVGCTGNEIRLVEVQCECRSPCSQPTRRFASLCDACAQQVATAETGDNT